MENYRVVWRHFGCKRQGDPVAYRGRHCGLGVQRWSDAEVPCLRLVLRLCLRLVAYVSANFSALFMRWEPRREVAAD